MLNTLRVSSHSDPTATAGAIANGVRERNEVGIEVIGPRAVNQAVKAIAIARGYVASSGADLYCVPSFATVQVDSLENEKTAIHFMVRPRHPVADVFVQKAGRAAGEQAARL